MSSAKNVISRIYGWLVITLFASSQHHHCREIVVSIYLFIIARMRQNSGDRGSDGVCVCALVNLYSNDTVDLNSRMEEGDLSLVHVEVPFHSEWFTRAFYLPVFLNSINYNCSRGLFQQKFKKKKIKIKNDRETNTATDSRSAVLHLATPKKGGQKQKTPPLLSMVAVKTFLQYAVDNFVSLIESCKNDEAFLWNASFFFFVKF